MSFSFRNRMIEIKVCTVFRAIQEARRATMQMRAADFTEKSMGFRSHLHLFFRCGFRMIPRNPVERVPLLCRRQH